MIHTVVCTDINDYVNWQCELLEYSWSRINQPGKLVRLVACEESETLPEHRHMDVFRTRPSNVHPISGDVYVCYNRLYSLQQWLNEHNIQGTVLIVDSDVVFKAPLKTEVQPGRPVGQHWLDYAVGTEFGDAIQAAAPNADIDAFQAVTWPALIDADDLRQLLPRWIELTVLIREQIKRQESDMYAFLAAAQEIELEFGLATTTAFMPWPDHQVAGAPIVHYCQAVNNKHGEKIWSKFDYKPWQHVDGASTTEMAYCTDLLNQLNEFSQIKNVESKHDSDLVFIAIASYCEPELIDTIDSCLSKARHPQNLRFGICLQFDNSNPLTNEYCLDRFSQDARFRYVSYDFNDSRGGCWARNIAQQLYQGERYTLQIDAHTRMIESWDTILIEMLHSLPSDKPLITQCPPLYSVEENGLDFHHITDLTQVNIAVAKKWVDEGWLDHSQTLTSQYNHFPRQTRLLSGGFVFTTGEWNEVVTQDPEHFYTGEELALTLRSFTHGYDLFDPSQIVAWHRLHPTTNRKFWNDHSDELTTAKHNLAIRRLNLLTQGDEESELGPFGLGAQRSLYDYAEFSGIDCVNKTIHANARNGVPPIRNFEADSNNPPIHHTMNTETLLDVTVYLEGMQPLELSCYETTPILMNLFQGLKNKSALPDDVIYLNLGEHGTEQIYFKQKQILSIETNPTLSSAFFERYMAQNNADVIATQEPVHYVGQQHIHDHSETTTVGGAINDEWKIWIWKSVEQGCSKGDIFRQMVENGFSPQVAGAELNYDPIIAAKSHVILPPYVANPVATRIDNDKLEIYSTSEFLNAQECEQLYALTVDNCQRSTVMDASGAENTVDRTSSSCFFDLNDSKNALAAEVSERIAKFIGINPTYGESIQAQFYKPGEEYKAHLDWIDPNISIYDTHASVAAGGQRTWSVLVYLNNVKAGGETKFPLADLEINPEMGKLVYWNNSKADGELNRDTLHQACPVLEGEKIVLTLWYRSLGQGPIYIREPSDLIPRYTVSGFQKQMMPAAVFESLTEFYSENASANQRDEFVEGGFLKTNTKNVPSTMVDLPETLKQLIHHELLAICEEWSKQPLELTSIYGIREYARGTSLVMHTDVQNTHIISVILNVAQQVDQHWPLEVDDHMCRRHSVILQPGEMLLYEGGRLAHGRPEALKGDNYANVFVHFSPTGYINASK